MAGLNYLEEKKCEVVVVPVVFVGKDWAFLQ